MGTVIHKDRLCMPLSQERVFCTFGSHRSDQECTEFAFLQIYYLKVWPFVCVTSVPFFQSFIVRETCLYIPFFSVVLAPRGQTLLQVDAFIYNAVEVTVYVNFRKRQKLVRRLMISSLAFQHLLLFQGIFSWWERAHSAVVFHAERLCGSISLGFFVLCFFSRHVFQHVSKGLESAHCVVTCAYLTLLCSLTSFCLQSLGSYLTISKEF